MRIRFVYPSWDRPSQCHPELADVDASPYIGTPSLAAASLAAVTPPQHEVSFVDDRVVRLEPGPGPDLVAIPIFTPAADRAMELADGYRAAGVTVVAGGIFATIMPDVIAPHVDALCIGEGEGVWPRMLRDLEAGELRPRYVATNDLDLGSFGVPRYELYTQWVDELRSSRKVSYPDLDFPVQLSRGCSLSCDHCVVPEYVGHKVRLVPPEKIRGCFESIMGQGNWRGATLIEDTQSLPSPRLLQHLAEVARACEDLPTRVAYIGSSPQFIRAAKETFFESVRSLGALQIYLMFGFGPTSRDATAHNATAAKVQLAVDAVRKIQDHGLEVYGSFAIGQEHEDESVFDRVLELCRLAEIRVAEFAVATPYPGTPAWTRLAREDRLLGRPWREFNDANVVYKPRMMSPETLQRIYIDLWQEFYRDRPRSRWPVQL